jgi:replicative DNA helicase
MNITLSVDREILERARKVARSMGKSLNEVVRDYLDHLAGQASAEDDIGELRELSQRSKGRSRGWKFDRDSIHDRS